MGGGIHVMSCHVTNATNGLFKRRKKSHTHTHKGNPPTHASHAGGAVLNTTAASRSLSNDSSSPSPSPAAAAARNAAVAVAVAVAGHDESAAFTAPSRVILSARALRA